LPAQYTTTSLGGTVVGATGAAVPDAGVTARNTDTGFTQCTVTNGAGAFFFPRLPVGPYEVKVEKPGFATYIHAGITVTVDQPANLPVARRSAR
jgi:hypothetical protein